MSSNDPPGHECRNVARGVWRCECGQHLGTSREKAREFYRFHVADVTDTMVLTGREFNRPPRPRLAPTRFCRECGEEKDRERFPTRERLCEPCYRRVCRDRTRKRAQGRDEKTQHLEPRPKPHALPKPEVERKARVGPGLISDTISARITQQDAVTVLTGAASWVGTTEWLDEDPRPDVVRCLLSSCAPEMESFARGEHWGYAGAYVPQHITRSAARAMMNRRASRTAYLRLLDLLTEAAGIGDLETWSTEYSTGPQDVVELFGRAAALVGTRCA